MTAEEMKQERAGLGLTQAGLAAYLGKSRWTIAQWEQGRRAVGMDPFSLATALSLARLARAQGQPLPDWRRALVVAEQVGFVSPGARKRKGD